MHQEPAVDPEIASMVISLRDRFGAAGLAAALDLIREEIERTRAVTEEGLQSLEPLSPA